MKLDAVMDELGDALETIESLQGRADRWPVDTIASTPRAVVGYPGEPINYLGTMARGLDLMALDVYVVVSRASDRAARAAVVGYVAGSGPESVKAAIEAYAFTSADSVVVATGDISSMVIGAVEYLVVTFVVKVAGQGETN